MEHHERETVERIVAHAITDERARIGQQLHDVAQHYRQHLRELMDAVSPQGPLDASIQLRATADLACAFALESISFLLKPELRQ